MRRSSRLAVPLMRPEDVIPHLGKATHWRQGRSAKAVADAWFRAGDIPHSVRNVLAEFSRFSPEPSFSTAGSSEKPISGICAERLANRSLAILGIENELGILAVEAKVDESFGQLVSEWLKNQSEGKSHRLRQLCTLFNLKPDQVGHLRYQLLHRTDRRYL